MFGKWVTVNLGEGIKCEVFVLCVPSTPDDVLQERAVAQLSSRLTKRAADERNAPEGVDVSVAFGG